MSAEPHTPTVKDLRWEYIVKRMHDGATGPDAEAEFERALTQVRNDAVRTWGEQAISSLNAAYTEAPNQHLRDCVSFALGVLKGGTGAR